MKDIQITMDEPDTWMEKTGGYAKDITLRDYFAAKAISGMMSSRDPRSPRFHPEDDAAYVYSVADAMLKAREA